MAHALVEQLAKIEMDMAKAGYPKSAIYLALHNECKKYAAESQSIHYFGMYKTHWDMEEQQKQPQAATTSLSYAASLVPKYFPTDSAKANSDAFIASCERYMPHPENASKMVEHMVTNGIAPTVEGFYHSFWILYNSGALKRHDWDHPNGVIKKKPPVAFSGYDVSPDVYNKLAAAKSLQGMLDAVASPKKHMEPMEFQQSVMNTEKQKATWGGSSGKAPPPAPKPKQVDSVPDHGGARRFRHEDEE